MAVRIILLIFLLASVQSKADISITGSASVNYTSVTSSAAIEIMGSSSSASFVEFETYTTSTQGSSTTNTTLYTAVGSNKYKNMGVDLFIAPALLVNLIPGDMYFDVSVLDSKSSYKTLSIPPCCSSIAANLFSKPTIESDKNISILFNKKIKNSDYYLTGSYQNINSSRQSILPAKEDLMIGCISCINTVDRDKMIERYARLGFGLEKAINPNYSLYAQTAYIQMYLEYLVNSSALDLPFPKLSQNYEGIVNTFGVKIYPYKDLMIDINRDVFNLNGVNAPDKDSVKFLHKINNSLSIGFGYSDSKYVDVYSEVKSAEKSLLFRINF